jgi:uncharacterized protein
MERVSECRVFAEDGRWFLFLVASSALFEVDAEVATAVQRAIAGGGELGRGTAAAVVEALHAAGALVDAARPDESWLEPPPRDHGLSTLVLHLERRCPLRCSYCYGREQERRSGPDTMSRELAERAVDFLFDHRGADGPLGITFFGGEPLSNLPALHAAAARAHERAGRADRELRFAITTSGIGVTDEVVGRLAELRATVTLSLDGDRAIHDAVRRRTDGRGSYDQAVAALVQLRQVCDVGVRATVTRLAPDPVRIADHLWGLGASSVGLAMVDVDDPGLALGPAELDLVEAGLGELADRYVREARAGRPRRLSNLEGLLRTLHRGTSREYPCGAGLRLVSCDTDGALYTCHRLVGDAGHRLGNLDHGLRADRSEAMTALSLRGRPECAPCWARHLCGGGCHHARAVHRGGRHPMAACPWLRRWLQRGLGVYATLVACQSPHLDQQIGDRTGGCLVE